MLQQYSASNWRSVFLCAAVLAATAPAVAQQRDGADGDQRVTTTDHAVEFYISDDAMQAQYVRNLDLGDFGPTEVRAGGTGFVIGFGRSGSVLGPILAGFLFAAGAGLSPCSGRSRP